MAARRLTIARRTERDRDARGLARAMSLYGCGAIHGSTAEGSGAGVSDDPARRTRPTG